MKKLNKTLQKWTNKSSFIRACYKKNIGLLYTYDKWYQEYNKQIQTCSACLSMQDIASPPSFFWFTLVNIILSIFFLMVKWCIIFLNAGRIREWMKIFLPFVSAYLLNKDESSYKRILLNTVIYKSSSVSLIELYIIQDFFKLKIHTDWGAKMLFMVHSVSCLQQYKKLYFVQKSRHSR